MLRGSRLTMKLMSPWRYSTTSFERWRATRLKPMRSNSGSSRMGGGRGELDEFEPHEAHGVLEQIGHDRSPVGVDGADGGGAAAGAGKRGVVSAAARPAGRARCAPDGHRRTGRIQAWCMVSPVPAGRRTKQRGQARVLRRWHNRTNIRCRPPHVVLVHCGPPDSGCGWLEGYRAARLFNWARRLLSGFLGWCCQGLQVRQAP